MLMEPRAFLIATYPALGTVCGRKLEMKVNHYLDIIII